MFNTKNPPERPTAVENPWPDHVELLAREAELEALREAPKKLREHRAELKADIAGYAFSCRRHGDFLTVFVERSGEKRAVTLNLGKSPTFQLIAGRAPDAGGELGYRYFLQGDDGYIGGSGMGNDGKPAPPPPGFRYAVQPREPGNPSRELVVESVVTSGVGTIVGWSQRNPDCRYKTPNYPRAAEDDRIYFSGIGVKVCAPAGRGQAVLDAIHKEIGRAQ